MCALPHKCAKGHSACEGVLLLRSLSVCTATTGVIKEENLIRATWSTSTAALPTFMSALIVHVRLPTPMTTIWVIEGILVRGRMPSITRGYTRAIVSVEVMYLVVTYCKEGYVVALRAL